MAATPFDALTVSFDTASIPRATLRLLLGTVFGGGTGPLRLADAEGKRKRRKKKRRHDRRPPAGSRL